MAQQNPVDHLIKAFGLTRLEMTEKYGFGANHLLLAAQGRKDSLGPTLLSAFDVEAAVRGLSVDQIMGEEYGAPDLTAAWEQWRIDQRADVDLPDVPEGPDSLSPWARIVETYGSVAKLSRTLRVRDLVVSRYVDKPRMPSALREALEDTGWKGLRVLESEQQEYFRA